MAFLFYFDGMNYVSINGQITEEGQCLLQPDNHSYRYGDGLFETMKVECGSIKLAEYHFERLFSGIELLKFKLSSLFARPKINNEIIDLCRKNKCEDLARVRLSVTRGNGGLYDCNDHFAYMIECWPLEKSTQRLNENGLVIDIFPDSIKSCDKFSNLKSANYLPYVMAAVWAKENKLNEALILNQHRRICDATIANIFVVKGDQIFTPPLSEGCVAGVMRKKILESEIQTWGFFIKESVLTEGLLLDADEIFFTNAISVIRWVKQFRDKTYINRLSSKIFSELLKTNSA